MAVNWVAFKIVNVAAHGDAWPRSGRRYAILRHANPANVWNAGILQCLWNQVGPAISETKGEITKTRAYAADYYRPILSGQAHSLKQLDAFAKIVLCNRGQEIPRSVSPPDIGIVSFRGGRRCALRTDGRRQILDLMLLEISSSCQATG